MENKTNSTKLGILYSIPSFLEGMLAQMENTFFFFFMTDIALLSTAATAKVSSIGSALIAVSSLFSGVVMQSITFKKGKYRPWLIYGGIGILIGRFMQFTKINASESVLIIWFIVGYVLMNFAYAFTSTSYNALVSMISPDNDTRVKIVSWKTVASNIMKLIFGAVSVGFIAMFDNAVTGYSVFGNITGVLAFAGCLFLFYISRNSDDAKLAGTAEKKEDTTKVNIIEMLKYTFINKNAILFLLAMWCKVASSLLITFSVAYYYNYTANNPAMLSVYLTLSSFITILAAFVTPFLAKLCKGVRNTYGISLFGYAVVFVLAFILKTNALIVTILLSINQFFWGVYQSAELPLFMGVIDYTEYKTGKDLTAFMMSVWTFSIKVGIVIANASLSFGLLKIGFEATAITESAIASLPVVVFLIPAVYAVLGGVFTFLIPLSDAKIQEYRELNKAKKEAK